MPQGCVPQQLRNEMRIEGVVPAPSVHYDPTQQAVEIPCDPEDDATVEAVVQSHEPDPVRVLPPETQELLGLIEAQETGTLDPDQKPRLDELLASHVKASILGGLS